MRIETNLIIITFDMAKDTASVLLDKNLLPKGTITGEPLDVVHKVSSKYIDIEPKFITYEVEDFIYHNNRGVVLYSTFLPSPVPIKKGKWHIAWEIFREDENSKIFNVVQKAAQRAFQRTQTRPYNIFS